jgi:hypothetical protein
MMFPTHHLPPTKQSLAMMFSSLFVESLHRYTKQFILTLLSCLSFSVALHHASQEVCPGTRVFQRS